MGDSHVYITARKRAAVEAGCHLNVLPPLSDESSDRSSVPDEGTMRHPPVAPAVSQHQHATPTPCLHSAAGRIAARRDVLPPRPHDPSLEHVVAVAGGDGVQAMVLPHLL